MLDTVSKILIGNIPKGLSDVISYNVDRAIKGEIGQFIHGLDVYLGVNDKVREQYIKKGKDALIKLSDESPKNKIKDELMEALPDSYFAFTGALEEGVMIGFDMEKEGCVGALYTRNFKLITKLAKLGYITNADKIEKAELLVKGAKTFNGLKDLEEVAIGVVRLDFDSVVEGTTRYKITVPQQPLRVGLNNPILMTPLKAMYILSCKLDSLFENQIVRFTSTTTKNLTGIKQGVVTSSEDIIRQVYEPNDVTKKLNIIQTGYDYGSLRYYIHDLESSVYSKGFTSIRLEMLDRLEVLELKDIDKSKHLVNFRLLKTVYDEKVKGFDLDDMYTIKFFDLSSFVTVEDKCEALLLFAKDLSGAELHTIMKQNPSLFGDLEYELQQAEYRLPKVVKDLKAIPIPQTVSEFKELIENGLVKVTTLTKKGKVSDVCVTNNKKILTQMLGGDYVREYESAKYRFLEFKKVLNNSTITDKVQLENLALKYGIDLELISSAVDSNFTGDVTNLISKLDEKLDELNAKTKSKEKSPTTVTVRKVYAKDTKDLYSTIDVNQILQIDYVAIS